MKERNMTKPTKQVRNAPKRSAYVRPELRQHTTWEVITGGGMPSGGGGFFDML